MDNALAKSQERKQSSKRVSTNQQPNVQSSCFKGDLPAAGGTTTMKKLKASTDKTKTLLPENFTPSEYSVICGNKRAYFNSVGNSRFRVICKMHAEEYRTAQTKNEKSYVVSNVMKILRNACPVGSFVTLEKGRWWEVSDRTAREKVGTFFRDLCSPDYKSSSKNKIAQRKVNRKQSSSSLEESSEPLQLETAPKSAKIDVPTMPEGPSSLHNLFAPNSRTAGTVNPRLRPFMSLTASLNSTNHATSSPVYSAAGHAAANSYAIATSTWEQTLSQAFITATTAGNADDEDSFSSSSESLASFYDVDNLMPSSLQL
jgi:hypothetical protein